MDQTNPQVAMDAAGDFVITWQSVVPDYVSPGSVSDIFARRFSPAGYITQYQDIQFAPTDPNATTLSGQFQLITGRGETNLIAFDSTDLNTVAAEVQSELIGLGYDPSLVVTVTSGTAPFALRITWGGADIGASIPLVSVDPLTESLAAAVTVTSPVPFIADMNHDGTPDTPIEGVRADGDQFQVNTVTFNAQTMPSVGMDAAGNFTIAWESGGQELSYFNSIWAQRYDYNGNPIGNQFQVNTGNNNTTYSYDPIVGVSDDGIAVIAWSNTNDPNYFLGNTAVVAANAVVYNSDGTVLESQFPVAAGGEGLGLCFDANDDFVITYTHTGVASNIGGAVSQAGTFAQEWQLFNPTTHALAFANIEGEFRVNSSNLNGQGNGAEEWPSSHLPGNPAMDANGDLTVAYYDGGGPDISEFSSQNTSEIANSGNAYTSVINPLTGAASKWTSPATSACGCSTTRPCWATAMRKLAQVRTEMEGVYPYTPAVIYTAPNGAVEVANAGLLQGANFTTEFTQIDANPVPGNAPSNVLSTDNVADASRTDQQNATYMVAIQDAAVTGALH